MDIAGASGRPSRRNRGPAGARAARSSSGSSLVGSYKNEMDEISYTKRAPCLMNYDKTIKKEHEAAQNAKVKEKHQNLYFDTSQQQQPTAPSSCKCGTLESHIEFNKAKKQKSNHTVHKKNKVVTSTPLRCSQRQTQNTSNNKQLNTSYDTYCSFMSGFTDQSNSELIVKAAQRPKKSRISAKNTGSSLLNSKSKPETILKEQLDNMSDVSGQENPNDSVSKTSSGRSLTPDLRQTGNSVLVYSNSTDKVSTVNTLMVPSPHYGRMRVKHASARITSQTNNQCIAIAGEVQRNSVREQSGFAACFYDTGNTLNVASQPTSPHKRRTRVKNVSARRVSPHTKAGGDSARQLSGFAACFSDSDDEKYPLKQRKYFC